MEIRTKDGYPVILLRRNEHEALDKAAGLLAMYAVALRGHAEVIPVVKGDNETVFKLRKAASIVSATLGGLAESIKLLQEGQAAIDALEPVPKDKEDGDT